MEEEEGCVLRVYLEVSSTTVALRLVIQCCRAGSNLVPICIPAPFVAYRYPSRGSVAILPKALSRDTLLCVRALPHSRVAVAF
jgi:hypothetical protein